jgi:hypothetical protein
LLGAPTWIDDPRISLRMIGWDLAADRIELYMRCEELDAPLLVRLLDLACARHRYGELMDLLHAAYRRPVTPNLPAHAHGLTVAVERTNRTVVAVSVCTFALAMFGVDGAARAAILALAATRGWDLGAYPAVSAPLAGKASLPTVHQMVTITATADRLVGFQIGLRPPDHA